MRISRTALSCLLRLKAYGAYPAGAALFLGLDNIGPFDRSAALPSGGVLEQSDATAWMAKYCLNMLEIALRLANHDAAYEDIAIKFFEHFALIAAAMNELWDEQDGFFYDRVRKPDGQVVIVRARSMVGLLPIFASVRFDASLWGRLPNFRARTRWFVDNVPKLSAFIGIVTALWACGVLGGRVAQHG